MMGEQTVVIGGVETIRSGETNGKKWTIYKVTDGNGTDLGSCFQDVANAATGLVGKRALIVNEVEQTQKNGQTYNNLKLRSVEPAAEEPASNGNGDVDWDGKELRGHRRAAVAIAVASFAGDPTFTEAMVFSRAEHIVNFVYAEDEAAASFPVPPAFTNDDDIPF